jgi:hypothetical protein
MKSANILKLLRFNWGVCLKIVGFILLHDHEKVGFKNRNSEDDYTGKV